MYNRYVKDLDLEIESNRITDHRGRHMERRAFLQKSTIAAGSITAEELKKSLKRLRTDYFDLYQLHAITDLKKDMNPIFQSEV